MVYNIGNALLIIGAIYFHLVYGLDPVITAMLVVFGIITWNIHGFTKERKQLFEAMTEYYYALRNYYRARAWYYELRAKYYNEKRKALIQ